MVGVSPIVGEGRAVADGALVGRAVGTGEGVRVAAGRCDIGAIAVSGFWASMEVTRYRLPINPITGVRSTKANAARTNVISFLPSRRLGASEP